MSRKHGLLASIFLCGTALPVLAQGLEFGPGLTLEGNAELQYYHLAGGPEGTVVAPDLTLRWQSAGMFGAEATLDSVYDFKTDDDYTNIWAAVTMELSFGTIKVGAPRPVTETLKPMTSFGSSVAVNTELRSLTGSVTSAMALTDGGLVPGIAAEGQTGDLTWGVSLHQVDLNEGDINTDFTLLEGVMVREVGAGRYFGALQLSDSDLGNHSSAEVGALWDAQPMQLGLRVGRESFVDSTYGQLQIGYDVMPALNLSADLMRVDIKHEGAFTVYGASAKYELTPNAYLKAGATSTSNDSLEVYDLTLGWTF